MNPIDRVKKNVTTIANDAWCIQVGGASKVLPLDQRLSLKFDAGYLEGAVQTVRALQGRDASEALRNGTINAILAGCDPTPPGQVLDVQA